MLFHLVITKREEIENSRPLYKILNREFYTPSVYNDISTMMYTRKKIIGEEKNYVLS